MSVMPDSKARDRQITSVFLQPHASQRRIALKVSSFLSWVYKNAELQRLGVLLQRDIDRPRTKVLRTPINLEVQILKLLDVLHGS